ncbi:MAG: hypothetical protein JWP57_4032 [Spirosoma sp.]|nr:hypothetical protein [Spirosoma sp.]
MKHYRYKTITIASFSLLLLSGCTNWSWQRNGLGTMSLQQAEATCAMEVERVAPLYGSGSPIAIGMQRTHTENICMQANGFQKVRNP